METFTIKTKVLLNVENYPDHIDENEVESVLTSDADIFWSPEIQKIGDEIRLVFVLTEQPPIIIDLEMVSEIGEEAKVQTIYLDFSKLELKEIVFDSVSFGYSYIDLKPLELTVDFQDKEYWLEF